MLALILAALLPVLHMHGGLLSIGESFAQSGHRYTVKAYNYKHHLAAVSQDGSPPVLTKYKVEPIQDSCLQIASTAPLIACGAVLSTVNPNNPVYDYKSVVIQNLVLTNGAHTLTPGNCLQLDATDNSVETASVACGGTVTAGTTQNGTDPGGGICVSGTTVNLCGAITATTTFANATPLAFTNTTGPTIITSAATTGSPFRLQPTGSTTGNLFELLDKTGTSICIHANNNGSLQVDSACSGGLTVQGNLAVTSTSAAIGIATGGGSIPAYAKSGIFIGSTGGFGSANNCVLTVANNGTGTLSGNGSGVLCTIKTGAANTATSFVLTTAYTYTNTPAVFVQNLVATTWSNTSQPCTASTTTITCVYSAAPANSTNIFNILVVNNGP